MKFRLMSDLHLEFGGMDVPPLPEDASTTLVLAGDIGLADRTHTYEKFIKRMANQFKDVIWINGNHEFYHSSFIRAPEKIRAHLDLLLVPNVHYGNNFTVVIDDVAFICATLWTDMDQGNPSSQYFIQGPQGFGFQGVQGNDGYQGVTGVTGAQGNQGLVGVGAQGPQGI